MNWSTGTPLVGEQGHWKAPQIRLSPRWENCRVRMQETTRHELCTQYSTRFIYSTIYTTTARAVTMFTETRPHRQTTSCRMSRRLVHQTGYSLSERPLTPWLARSSTAYRRTAM